MKFLNYFKQLFKSQEPPYFDKIRIVSSLSEVPDFPGLDFFVVRNYGTDKWAVFSCPNNCGQRVEVNLMKIRHPYWRLQIKKKRVTLYPSVIVKDCGAHFWVINSLIEWAFEDEEELSY